MESSNEDLSLTPDMRRAALWYAQHGLPVFPLHWRTDEGCSCDDRNCHSPAKHPRTLNGFKDATTDVGKIEEWWKRWPLANIGVPTGNVSGGLLVVDEDPRNGGGESIELLIAAHGHFPDTAEQITGGGGRHRIFRYGGGPVPKTLAPGIDLKGDGGYVVVAPSMHSSGKRYAWDGIAGPKAVLTPADAPGWLLEYISRDRSHAKSNGNTGRPEIIPDGEKHNTIVSLAGTMRRAGFAQQFAFSACRSLQFASLVSDEDIQERVESVYRLYPAGGRSENPSAENNFHCSHWPAPLAKKHSTAPPVTWCI